MQNHERIVQLLYRRLKGSPLTVEENSELDEWLARSESNRRIYESLSDEEWMKTAKEKYYAPGKEEGLAQLREQLFAEETPITQPSRWVRRMAVAASVLLILASAIYYLVPTKQANLVTLNELINEFETPGGEAILTLSNGSKIPYSEHANGLLAQLSDGKQLLKQDGKLVYQVAIAQLTAGSVDTTTAPRSDQYSVRLSDGSRVWLNRNSKLRYPESFAGDKRVVELSGEAYFEIAQVAAVDGNGKMPFIVKMLPRPGSTEISEVEVLGTHFNIYARKNEAIRTTLTEGKVKMTRGDQSQLLQPGQQAVVDTAASPIQLKQQVDVESVLAWKNYRFQFREESIHSIMTELQHWYGFSFVVNGKINKPFTLICDRNKPLSEVINELNASGKAHIELIGNNYVVTP